MVFLKEFFKNVDFEKSQQTTSVKNFQGGKELKKVEICFIRIPSVSNSLDPDQAQHFVGPDLGLNCLQRLSAVR